MPLSNAQPFVRNTISFRLECRKTWKQSCSPHLGQGSGGRPVAGKPHAGKYRELTLLRQRGGRGSPSPLPSRRYANERDGRGGFVRVETEKKVIIDYVQIEVYAR
jgi:hypothetical protein